MRETAAEAIIAPDRIDAVIFDMDGVGAQAGDGTGRHRPQRRSPGGLTSKVV